MNLFKKAAALAAIGVASALGSAHAATITQNDSITLTLLPISDTLDFLQFNPALGTLTSVTLQMTATLQANQAGENRSASPGTITFNSTMNMLVTGLNLGAGVTLIPQVIQTFAASAFDGNNDNAGTSGVTLPAATDSKCYGGPACVAQNQILAGFSGLGAVVYNVGANASNSGSGVAQLSQEFSTLGALTAQLIYNYDPVTPPCGTENQPPCPRVPEPGVVSLLGLGLVGLLLARRRKQV